MKTENETGIATPPTASQKIAQIKIKIKELIGELNLEENIKIRGDRTCKFTLNGCAYIGYITGKKNNNVVIGESPESDFELVADIIKKEQAFPIIAPVSIEAPKEVEEAVAA